MTTRASLPVSFVGVGGALSCELHPATTISDSGELISYPHFHVPVDALVATSTNLEVEQAESPNEAQISAPKSPQSTAVIRFNKEYTVRVFMHDGNEISFIPGNPLPITRTPPWSRLHLPSTYTIGFRFEYGSSDVLWRVVGTENAELTGTTLGFDKDRSFSNRDGEQLQISGFSHPFPNTPLNFEPVEWPLAAGQHVTFGPNTRTIDYEPMLLVAVAGSGREDLLDASPVQCKTVQVNLDSGELSAGSNAQAVRSSTPIRIQGNVEVRAMPDESGLKYILNGTSGSIDTAGRELIPTRFETIGPFWEALLGTLAASLIAAAIATKGKIIRDWFRG